MSKFIHLFTCNLCRKSFKEDRFLKDHKLIHIEKRLDCNSRAKHFKQSLRERFKHVIRSSHFNDCSTLVNPSNFVTSSELSSSAPFDNSNNESVSDDVNPKKLIINEFNSNSIESDISYSTVLSDSEPASDEVSQRSATYSTHCISTPLETTNVKEYKDCENYEIHSTSTSKKLKLAAFSNSFNNEESSNFVILKNPVNVDNNNDKNNNVPIKSEKRCGTFLTDSINLSNLISLLEVPDSKNEKRPADNENDKNIVKKIIPKRLKHKGPFICNSCKKTFKTHWFLKEHKRIHNEERPYGCSQCVKRFKQWNHLSSHIQSHSKKKAFSCTTCGKKFSLKRTLLRHKETHINKSSFQCEICNMLFTQKYNLKTHMRKHLGNIKAFTCETCSRGFTKKKNLEEHMYSHTQSKPFACQYCDNSFARKYHLQRHMAHHNLRQK